MSATSPTAQTDPDVLTCPREIREALDTLGEGDIVRINDRDPQRVTDTTPMAVIVQGSWTSAATYELHQNQWGDRPELVPTDLQRRIIEDSVEVRTLAVEHPTTLSAWL